MSRLIKSIALVALTGMTLTGMAATPAVSRDRPPERTRANPGRVIADEIAFARLAQDKGQWTAFRAMAAPTAEMFTPKRVKAADWLKNRADPAQAVRWQPHAAWSSCDGSIAVTHGAWQSGSAANPVTGYFTTVWERQRNGRYKWLLDHGDVLPMPIDAPEMISAKVAECSGTPGVPLAAPAVGEDMKQGIAHDQTLLFTSTVTPDGGRTVTIRLWNGTAHDVVLQETVAAPEPGQTPPGQ